MAEDKDKNKNKTRKVLPFDVDVFYDRAAKLSKDKLFNEEIMIVKGQTYNIALTAMKYCFILNAGALAALPPLLKFLEKESSPLPDLEKPIVFFVLGIFCSLIAFAFAAWSTNYEVSKIKAQKSCAHHDVLILLMRECREEKQRIESIKDSQKEKEEAFSTHKRHALTALFFSGLACLVAASLFMFGCFSLIEAN